MEKPITLTVLSTQTRAEIRDTITAGDSDAYPLSITFSDLTAITGTVRFRFVRGDDYWDRDATVAANVASLMLEPAFYAATGTELWISFEDSNLYTPLHVYFRDIRVPSGNTEAATSQPYPAWAEDMREFDVDIGTVETLEPGADATASITGDVPNKLLNLGIPQGATGAQGPQGDKGDPNTLSIGSVDTLAPAEPATATITGTSPNQTLSLGIPKGDKGDKGDAATVAVGTVTTLDAGESATVANRGTSGAAVLDFGLPQGAKGDKGDAGEITIGTVTTLAPGESATVTNSGTSTDAVLDIGIPAGYDGSAVPVDDASSAADRVLSAQYVKGQLAQKIPLTRQSKYWNRPAAYKIKVAAGRFNMSWNNASGRMWIFPAGTVLYSDGTTPIRTSTAEKPDVTIPVGGGYVWLVSAAWNGLYSLLDNDTDARLTGALSDLPLLTNTLSLGNCSLVTGALSDLPPLTYYLDLGNCKLVTGALSDLPPLTYYLSLYNCTLVTGALSDLPPLTYFLNLGNCSQVTGALSDLPPLTYYLNLYNCSLVTGAYTTVNGNSVPATTTLTGTGLSATDMDNTLIAYAACTKTGGTFTATGKTRTAASDAAVAHLTTEIGSGGLGWTVDGITKV